MSIVTRVNSAYHSPRILLPMQWTNATWNGGGAGVNPFPYFATGDPNANAFPIWYATGRAGIDGNFTVALTAGFTPPITLTAWEYNRVAAAWFQLGADSALYQTTFDTTYAQSTFLAGENATILISSSVAITGNAYIDGTLIKTKPGAPQEG